MNTSNDNKVMACVDQSPYADFVGDYAAWAAQRMEAPLEFLHVIDRHPEIGSGKDHSGAIGLNAQEKLLSELSADDEARTRAARERGRVFLNRLRERAVQAGALLVDVRQRYGTLEETLVEQEAGVRLIVLGRRGESAAATHADLGRHVERIVRSLHKPILTVTESFKPPQRVLMAFDGSAVTRRGVDMVAASPLFRGLPVHVLVSGKESQDAPKQMAWATSRLVAAGFEVVPHLRPGDPESTIAKTIVEQSIDVLIMGSYSHSPLRSLLLGSKTSDLLRSAKIPTLLLR